MNSTRHRRALTAIATPLLGFVVAAPTAQSDNDNNTLVPNNKRLNEQRRRERVHDPASGWMYQLGTSSTVF